MYEKYLDMLDEAGKIRNLKERSISCYKNYVSYFLNYVGKDPEKLPVEWEHAIPYGLLHSPAPPETVQRFLSTLQKAVQE